MPRYRLVANLRMCLEKLQNIKTCRLVTDSPKLTHKEVFYLLDSECRRVIYLDGYTIILSSVVHSLDVCSLACSSFFLVFLFHLSDSWQGWQGATDLP